MNKVTIDAKSKQDAIKKCLDEVGWMPDAVRKVDSGSDKIKAWMCFESASDADTWDKQK